MRSYLEELKTSLSRVSDTQRAVAAVTATAWSPDRLVKAVVGPRGQLLELEIDPRVYRQPNSKALAATIVSTVRAAVEQAGAKVADLVAANLPKEPPMGDLPRGPMDYQRLMRTHDADLKKVLQEADDDDLR
jgi:DNA-binding protein YbaB